MTPVREFRRRAAGTITAWLLAAASLCCGHAAAADEFRNVKCGGDIPKAMIGQRALNEPVVRAEARYRALGLKHLGADETSDKLSSINWMICGAEYITLVDNKNIVRDAMPFPPHSKKTPAFSNYCQRDGKKLPDIFVGTLNAEVAGDQLPAVAVWKIDLGNARFVKAPVEGLRCPRNGIFTFDGGM